MVLEFILLFKRLNFAFLASEKREKVIEKMGLRHIEAVKVFEYGKNDDSYRNDTKLYQ